MVDPVVVDAIVTDTGPVNVPPFGETTGVAAEMVNMALETALLVMPLFTAIAFTVRLTSMVIGAEYRGDAVVGVLPSSV